MSAQNSSLTRVRPIFQQLLQRKSTGRDWLSSLLSLASNQTPLAKKLAADPGDLLPYVSATRRYRDRILRRSSYRIGAIELEKCFEKRVPPPMAFLRWLIEHPEEMRWPRTKHGRYQYGPVTQTWREKLFGEHGSVAQQEAIDVASREILTHGGQKSGQRWWAFEGFTDVDCCLETDKLLLFIEGKRTDTLSASTDWFDRRNQLARNLETAKELAGAKWFGVLLITEDPHPPIGTNEISPGLPHFSALERAELFNHFLGSLIWEDVCRITEIDFAGLPNTVDDVAITYKQEG